MKLDKFTPTEELLLIYSCDLVQRNRVTKLKCKYGCEKKNLSLP